MQFNQAKFPLTALLIAGFSHWAAQAATYQEVNGVVCVEAEHFDSRAAAEDSDHAYVLVPDEGPASGTAEYLNARGGKYMQVQPEAGANRNNPDLQATGPRLDYKVQINTPGEYQLYIRGIGYDGGADSYYAQILEISSPGWYRYSPDPNNNDFDTLRNDNADPDSVIGWNGYAAPEANSGDGAEEKALFSITAAGTYTIRFRQREDSNAIDAFVLQLSSKPPPLADILESQQVGAQPLPLSVSVTPADNFASARFDAGISATFVNGTTTLDESSVKLTLDGVAVTPTTKKDGNVIAYSHVPATFFAPRSEHSATLEYKDNTGKAFTLTWKFTAQNYGLITKDLKVTPDTSKRGFLWRVHQNNAVGQGNTNPRAESQLAGEIADENGVTLENLADPNAVGGADGPAQPPSPSSAPITFNVSSVINFSQTEGSTFGAFTPDLQMPGIPSTDGSMDSIAAEIITYIELPAGVIRMGVNSDDGFKTTIGATGDIFVPPLVAGEFNGGRGAADTIFTFVVAEPGVYPFRTIWEEGGGDANIEWFTFRPGTTTKVLVNDDANGGLKAYREALTTEKKAFARKVEPKPNSGGAALDAVIRVELVDGATPVETSSVKMKLDGAQIAATVTKAGIVTTATFKPATPFALKSKHSVEFSYTEAGSVIVRSWDFTTLNTDLLAYWDFNDASTPNQARDKVGGYVGAFASGARYTDDGKGRTGKAGDRAAKIGTGPDPVVNGIIRVSGPNVAFMNAGGIQNQLAVSLWQRLDETRNSSAFWATGSGQDRAFQAHIPWSDNTIYFDTGGGCCDGTQRINKNISEFPEATDPETFFHAWHHFVFQKNGNQKQIWIDGTLFLEGSNSSPLPSVFNLLAIGADSGGANNTHGDLDDFAVFATALTPEEIGRLAKGDSPDQVRPIQQAAAKFTSFKRDAGNVLIEWTGGGTLQSADNVNGPWTDVSGATSPRTITPSGDRKFYRIRQ